MTTPATRRLIHPPSTRRDRKRGLAGHCLKRRERSYIEQARCRIDRVALQQRAGWPAGIGADPIPTAEIRGFMMATEAARPPGLRGLPDRSAIDGAYFPFTRAVSSRSGSLPEGDFRSGPNRGMGGRNRASVAANDGVGGSRRPLPVALTEED